MKSTVKSCLSLFCSIAFLQAAATPPDCTFALSFSSGKVASTSIVVHASEMLSHEKSESNGAISLVWRGHQRFGSDFAVRASLVPDGVGGYTYGISYSGVDRHLAVDEIRFPIFTVPRSDSSKLLYPLQIGMLRKPDWRKYKDGETIVSRGPNIMGFHFAALVDEANGGWYVDQRGDARLRPGRFSFVNRSGGKVEITAAYFPTLDETKNGRGSLPFDGVVRPFRGGWFDAAKIYRDWVKTQPWFMEAKSREFKNLRPIAFWAWNRGRSSDVAPSIERFVEETGLPAALDWYWWHEIPYDVKYPNFWPPREPVEQFRATIERLKKKGVYVQTYTNGMLWDMDEPDWKEGGEQECMMFKSGGLNVTVFNTYLGHRMVIMCGESPELQRRMRKVERTLADCGLNGLYLDMIGNCMGSCWNPRHRHAPGGGTVMSDGYRAYLKAVKSDNPGVDVSTEEEGEAYLDVVDSLIVLYAAYERLGKGVAPEFEMVPVFHMLYHGCVAMYGSYSVIDGITPWDEKWGKRPPIDEARWQGRFPDQFALEHSRGVVWGQQPMVHKLLPEHQTDPKWAAEWKFIKDTARFYHAHRDFLFDGEMCDPGTLKCVTKPVDFFVRGCYTKEEKFKQVRQNAVPTVLHSVWKSPDGAIAAVLVNWTRDIQAYDFTAEGVRRTGTLLPLSWKCEVLK